VSLVTEFLVELYVSPTDADAVEHLAASAQIAAERQSGRGVSVRYLRSISVPEEETCFVFYDAPSREAATETARLANFVVVCNAVVETTEARPDDVPSAIEQRAGGTG
jgi:hypothetical protein